MRVTAAVVALGLVALPVTVAAVAPPPPNALNILWADYCSRTTDAACAVPTPAPAWAEEFTTSLGSFAPFEHQYNDLHVTAAACTVSGGAMNLTATSTGSGQWQSCMALTTRTFDHGYFEARMQYPAGLYDAGFWLRRDPLPATQPRAEIDIAEAYPFANGRCPGPNKYQATLHTDVSTTAQQVTYDAGHSLVGEWHTYGVEWLPGQHVRYDVDGTVVADFTSEVPLASSTMDVALSLGVGTTVYCGTANPGADTPTQAAMNVDWVRWHEAKP